MVIVAGHLIVAEQVRDDYLAGCVSVVEQARRAPSCQDFAISPDLLDPARIIVFERWNSQAAVEALRGDGTDQDQGRHDRVGLGFRIRHIGRTSVDLACQQNHGRGQLADRAFSSPEQQQRPTLN